jgi:hypothetical protein
LWIGPTHILKTVRQSSRFSPNQLISYTLDPRVAQAGQGLDTVIQPLKKLHHGWLEFAVTLNLVRPTLSEALARDLISVSQMLAKTNPGSDVGVTCGVCHASSVQSGR